MSRSRATEEARRTAHPLALLFLSILTAQAQTRPDPGQGIGVFDEQCAQCHSAYTADTKSVPSMQFLFAKKKLG